MSCFKTIDFHVEDGVAYIIIDNPPVNTLNALTFYELSNCIRYITKNNRISSAVITGTSDFFVAGTDIKEFKLAFEEEQKGEEIAKSAKGLFNQIEHLNKPIIAAINGFCLGSGLELAMSCHLRIAAHEALLGLPELKLGLIPSFGSTQRLARITNKAKALEIILTSKFIKGEEAMEIGLINQSVPLEELMATVKQVAESLIVGKNKVSIAAALDAFTYGLETTLEERVLTLIEKRQNHS